MVNRTLFMRLALAAVLVALVSACATPRSGVATTNTDNAQAVLSGQLVYRQRIAMSPDAVIHLRLVNVQQQAAIGSQVIRPQGRQVPIPFQIEYAASDGVEAHQYQLWVSVYDGTGHLRWTADVPVDGSGTAELRVRLAQAHLDRDALLGTQWQLQRIVHTDGTIDWARDKQPSTIVFDADGRIHGKAACNNFFGRYELKDGGTLDIGNAGATLMACPRSNVATAFLRSLAKVNAYAISGQQLWLMSDGAVLTFAVDDTESSLAD